MKRIEADIADTLLETPIVFSLGRKRFHIYPMTLGKSFIVNGIFDDLGLGSIIGNEKLVSYLFLAEVSNKRTDYIKLVAYYSLPKDDCLDSAKVSKRVHELRRIKDYELATLISVILSMDKTEVITKHFHLDDDKNILDRIMKTKDKNNGNITFGGHSVWGNLIDFICERYGWTIRYVLWEVSYANLSLLVSDHIRSVYLSDDEAKRARVSRESKVVRADNVSGLKEFVSTQSWR